MTQELARHTEYEFEYVDGPIQPIPRRLKTNIAWVNLGKALFNSPLLSKDNTVSCASCHMVDFGGDDGVKVSTGVDSKQGTRNAPTVLNAVFNFRQFWDGRAADLAEQAAGPIHNPIEMASNWRQVITKLQQDRYFSRTFAELGVKSITEQHIVTAITFFEESLITPNSAIDRYLLGDRTALNAQQQRGYQKFINLGCVTCHQGRNIGGNFYQKLGRLEQIPASLRHDKGRALVTGEAQDKYVFKVPSLRNITDTAPYFHDGSINTLEQAVTIMAATQLGKTLSDQDVDDLVALLAAFSAPPLTVNDLGSL
ncbi:cytochrome-c peroxidase [Saccharobesus litoralis]|uniref:cytochrome-c peroxidase n=1 Tax=Saccharobesus litoralis TaxID=2172099 RepID=UPI001E29C3C1|nr:cytochrome-c peroxidase [Saccharobesus litoralis]